MPIKDFVLASIESSEIKSKKSHEHFKSFEFFKLEKHENIKSLTPPELAEQYDRAFTESLKGANLMKEITKKDKRQSFLSQYSILKEHSYSKNSKNR